MERVRGNRTFQQNASNWEVYKDAFAPPAPRPRSKPWERAPVPAHAPRLQGHKIWKKAGLRSQISNNKENDDSAQLELAMEGAGARKKARVLGAKENILDAPWQPFQDVADEDLNGLGAITSPFKKDRKSAVGGSPDTLQVIPRKRTNADHLITPRKSSRRAPLKDLSRAVENVRTPRKSPQKLSLELNDVSLPGEQLHASPQKLPLNVTTGSLTSPRKCVRRRKSLRKSINRLTRSELSEERTKYSTSPPTSKFDHEVVATPTQMAIIKMLSTDSPPPPISSPQRRIKGAHSAIANEITLNTQPPTVLETSAWFPRIGALDTLQEADTNNPFVTIPTSDPAEDLSVDKDVEEQLLVEQAQAAAQAQNEALAFQAQLVQEPPSSPSKPSRSPKRKGRATPQRPGTRRSSRTTRTSSIAPIVSSELTQINLDAASEDSSERTGATSGQLPASIKEGRQGSTSASDMQETVALPSSGSNIAERRKSLLGYVGVETDDRLVTKGEVKLGSNYQDVTARGLMQSASSLPTAAATETSIEAYFRNMSKAEPRSPDHDAYEDETTVQKLEAAELASKVDPSNESFDADPMLRGSSTKDSQDGAVLEDLTEEDPESFEPISALAAAEILLDNTTTEIGGLQNILTPDPSITDLVEAISANAPANSYDDDDTDLLRNFLTKVQADKEAKADAKATQKRKRSFPHSPLRLPLGSEQPTLSPSPTLGDEFDVSLPAPSPTKRRKKNGDITEDLAEPRSIRRSGRTRLPIKSSIPAPSFIPVRRLGQNGDNTITLRRNEEKELAALTRVNTRKNKGGAISAQEVLAKQALEKDDPVTRKRMLKEKFDENSQLKRSKKEKRKSVVWAKELAQYQSADGRRVVVEKHMEKEREKPVGGEKDKQGAVRVDVRSSRSSLGMPANGTPAPKRKGRARS